MFEKIKKLFKRPIKEKCKVSDKMIVVLNKGGQEDMEEIKGFVVKGRSVIVRLTDGYLEKTRDGKVIESFGGFAPDKLKSMYDEMVKNTEQEALNG